MTAIEEKVLKMEFDNKKFESNVSTTLSTIEKLKSSLSFKNVGDGLSEIESASKGISFSSLSSSIDAISDKFSLLDIVGVTALVNIANQAVNSGKRILSSLTVDPIKTGLEEYETKMDSIKTILSNTQGNGSTLEDVNAVLDDLNTYSDKTVYNFAQMTNMVGKFAATSGKLDSSVGIVKGMANLAAQAGVANNELQSGLYQTSQALAGSFFQKVDWNSIENAGLATQSFRQDLLDAGVAAGTLSEYTKAMVENQELSFGASLTNEWLTSDVFESVVQVYALDEAMTAAAGEVTTFTKLMTVMAESVQSGWSQSWEAIIGDKNQSTALLTNISDGFNNLIGPTAAARNEALEYWNAMGGRDDTIQGLTNILNTLFDIVQPITEAFRNFFPAKTGDDLVEMSSNFLEMTETFKIGETSLNNLSRIFNGVFATLSIGAQIASEIGDGFVQLFSAFSGGGNVLAWLAEGGDRLVALEASLKGDNIIGDSVATVTNALIGMGTAFSTYMEPVFNKIEGWYSTVPGKIEALGSKLSNFMSSLGTISDFSSFDAFVLGSDDMTNALEKLNSAGDKTKEFFTKIKDGLTPVGNALLSVTDQLKTFYGWVKDKIMSLDVNWDNVVDVGIIGGLVVLFNKLRKFSIDDLFGNSDLYSGIIDALDGVRGALEAYQQSVKADAMLKIAAAVGILAASMFAISIIEPSKLGGAIAAISTLLLGLFGATGVLTKISSSKGLDSGTKLAVTMVALAFSMNLLADAVLTINDLDPESVTRSVTSMGILMAAMTAAMSAFLLIPGGGGSMLTVALGVVGLAFAMLKVTESVEQLAKMDEKKMWQGVLGVSAIFAAVSVFALATKKNKISALSGLGLLAVAKAMEMFYDAIVLYSDMKWEDFGNGMGKITLALAAVALNLKILQGANPIQSALGLLAVVGALELMLFAIQDYADMDIATMAKGVTTIMLALLAIAGPMAIMSGTNVIAASIGIGILAGSLYLLAQTINTFGSMDISTIAIGLGAIVVILAAVAGMALILAPVVPVIIALGVGILLISGAVFVASAGIFLLSAALTALAVSGVAGAAALTAVVTGMMTGFALGFIAILKIFNDNQDVIEAAINNILLTIINVINVNIPKIVELIFDLFIAILQIMSDKAPVIVDLMIDIVLGILKAIEDRMDEMHEAAFSLFIAFINGFTAALNGNTDELKEAMYDLFKALVSAALSILTNDRISYDQFMEAAGNIVGKIVEGAKAAFNKISEVFTELIDKAKEAIEDGADMVQAGKDFVQGFIDGVASYASDAWEAAKDIGASALNGLKSMLDINSPSKEADKNGQYFGQGFVNGVIDWVREASSASGSLGESAMTGLKSAIAKASEILSSADTAPVISPVLDLTDLEKNRSKLDSILGDTSVNASVAADATSSAQLASVTLLKKLEDVVKSMSGSGNVENVFNVQATIREDSDITDTARELYMLQVASQRG